MTPLGQRVVQQLCGRCQHELCIDSGRAHPDGQIGDDRHEGRHGLCTDSFARVDPIAGPFACSNATLVPDVVLRVIEHQPLKAEPAIKHDSAENGTLNIHVARIARVQAMCFAPAGEVHLDRLVRSPCRWPLANTNQRRACLDARSVLLAVLQSFRTQPPARPQKTVAPRRSIRAASELRVVT